MDQPQNSNSDNLKPADDAVSRGADAAPLAEAPPLTPAAWLANNAVYLIVIGALVGLIWYKFGLEGVWAGVKIVFGLGFVIFIHELGHFLTAKWCDVHVQTFSIGFGPALPGCSFQHGETTYKIAVLPLGGYVNMVGEGLEGDEDEDYPRSFKNKTVGQRMLIISAGVIMNVILGCILFIVVYYYHGILEPPAVVGRVDAGSPLWQKGIPSGALITKLDGVTDPTFKNLRRKVILSAKGEVLSFTYTAYSAEGQPEPEKTVGLLPRREANDPNPVVGVLPPTQLRLPPKPARELNLQPVLKDSPAAAARPLPVADGEVIVAVTDPDHPESVKAIRYDLESGTFDVGELSRRVEALKGKKMVVHVLPRKADDKAKPEEREVPLEGFQWDDAIVGSTEVPTDLREDAYNPFRVSELPRDPRHADGDQRDPFVFGNRLRQLAGKPIIIQVRRGDSQNPSPEHYPAGPVVNLFVPPAYHFTFGLRMKMGQVAGVREDSPAAKAEVKKGDELIKITLLNQHGSEIHTWEDLDPERLPFQLAQAASRQPGPKKVVLTVRREADRIRKDITCEPVDWDERWDNDAEVPLAGRSPLAIPQLGVAYWVLSQIVEVKPDSPAARAGLKKDDTLREYRYRQLSEFTHELTWSKWSPLETDRDGNKVYDSWASPFWYLQRYDYKEIEVKVKRPEEEVPEPKTLLAREDRTWPLPSRGLRLLEDYKIQKADGLGDALVMGGRETGDMIGLMYLQLRSLATGRVSFKGVAGPIGMLSHGFSIAQNDNYVLLLYLAMISINLAVVNFLPIPILDGGHMVFLIYEKLRGRPPTEKVRAIATYIGLAMIGFLMIFVFYQDIQNYVLNMFGS